ncbi:hypothetical protein ACQ4LE_004805 [Meloidogyne hapla]|uniref:ShKT domain-containing protein n=1 Tax=Meloidogyne hapla TaxID=6305 RepID=A0A1I8BRM5_MELHA
MCYEMQRLGYCDNDIYRDMMQKHCLAECGVNVCFDRRADLCPIWKNQPENFCNNPIYNLQTVELWCKATCTDCRTPPPPPQNPGDAKKK